MSGYNTPKGYSQIQDMYVVLYNPGAGGNMVSAVIDSKDYTLGTASDLWTNPNTLRMKFLMASFEENSSDIRTNLSNPIVDRVTCEEKISNILNEIEVEKIYSCIASHYFYYFIEKTNYKIILINDIEDEVSKWTLNRAIQHGHKIVDITSALNARKNVVNEYKRLKYSDRVIKTIDMHDILNGKLITILQEFIDTPLNEKLYKIWLLKNT